ncbi:hypothetical protein [Streptomyces sp. NPDC051561]|uniref:hypothetical protein n=1 Tax=Streptomyces sp. NPDC051561 TaxID=3365658 RepID=UPI0037A9D457
MSSAVDGAAGPAAVEAAPGVRAGAGSAQALRATESALMAALDGVDRNDVLGEAHVAALEVALHVLRADRLAAHDHEASTALLHRALESARALVVVTGMAVTRDRDVRSRGVGGGNVRTGETRGHDGRGADARG